MTPKRMTASATYTIDPAYACKSCEGAQLCPVCDGEGDCTWCDDGMCIQCDGYGYAYPNDLT